MQEPYPVMPLADGDHAALAAQMPDAAQTLLRMGDKLLTSPLVALLDWGSRRWARNRTIPYRDEIARIAAQVKRPGAWFANLNYEWGCSAAILFNASGAPVLARVLDWPFPRLGELAVVAQCQSAVGPWSNITWPGCVGVLQANAPGRFAACINQAPRRSFGLGKYLGLVAGWLYSRGHWFKTQGTPPVLLLRQVMEIAPDYATALHMLREAEVAAPVIFTLAGLGPDDYAIIQKSYAGTVVRHERAVSNCWLNPELPGDLGPNDAPGRLRALQQSIAAGTGFGWLRAPVLNQESRLAVELCPATGAIRAQGWNGAQAVTEIFAQG